MKAIIFDVDGTLADVQHRLHHLEKEPKDWAGFFSDMKNDPPIKPITELFRLLANVQNEEFYLLVVSARPDSYERVTTDWLHGEDLYFNDIYMRKAGDFRPDNIVKEEILQKILEDGYEPFLVIDDRPQVVEMWRSYGIKTLQCDSSESESKYDNQCLLSMLIGPSGSGKSTYTKKHYKAADVVSTDEIREMHGWGHSPEDLKKTWNYVHGIIGVRLKNGMKTVLDATNIKKKDRDAVHRIVPKGQLVEYIVIDRDYDTKIKDKDWRPEELISKHHKTFKSQLKDILNADGRPNVIVRDVRNKC